MDYAAPQMQRGIERTIRKVKREKNAYKTAGLKDDATTANIRLRRLNTKYREFSRAAGLPEQKERMKVTYVDEATLSKANSIKQQREITAAANAADDKEALKFFGADARDDLNSIVKRGTMKLQNGISCFPDGDPLNENVKMVKPLKT